MRLKGGVNREGWANEIEETEKDGPMRLEGWATEIKDKRGGMGQRGLGQ